MNYEVYLRNSEGKRGVLVDGIVSIKMTFRYNEPAKWEITGASLTECPVPDGADIAVFRDNQILLCGYVEKKVDKFDASTRIYDWELSGLSDMGKIGERLIQSDPTKEPDATKTYSATGILSTVLLDAIRNNAGQDALASRNTYNLIITSQEPVGEEVTIESKLESLLKLVQDNLTSEDIQIREVWDMSTGTWNILIGSPEDVSSKVIFSVDNETVASWERTITAPTANFLVVTGGKDSKGKTMWCSVSDDESIAKWGRIEGIVARSDIKKDDDSSETWASVKKRLETAAAEELQKASAQHGYKLEITETSRNVFNEDYHIGSVVSVRVGNDEFTSKVEEIKITYSGGVEKIEPSVGAVQKGELQKVFNELGKLNDQVKVLQKA